MASSLRGLLFPASACVLLLARPVHAETLVQWTLTPPQVATVGVQVALSPGATLRVDVLAPASPAAGTVTALLLDPRGTRVDVAVVDTRSPTTPPRDAGTWARLEVTSAEQGQFTAWVSANAPVTVSVDAPAGTAWRLAVPEGRVEDLPVAPSSWFMATPHHATYRQRLRVEDARGITGASNLSDFSALEFPNAVNAPGPAVTAALWRLDVNALDWGTRARGFPFWLTPVAATASAMGTGWFLRPSGSALEGLHLHHGWQNVLADLVPLLVEDAGDAAGLRALAAPAVQSCAAVTDATSRESAAWALAPDGLLRAVDHALGPGAPALDGYWPGVLGLGAVTRQACAVDADCLRGACGAGGMCDLAFDPQVDRPDHHQHPAWQVPARGVMPWGGAGWDTGVSLAALVAAATTPHPCNAWQPAGAQGVAQPALLHRAALALTMDLLSLRADLRFPGDSGPRSTVRHFVTLFLAADVLPSVMPREVGNTSLGQQLVNTWTRGLEQVLLAQAGNTDRLAPGELAALLLEARLLAHVTGAPLHQQVAASVERRVLAARSPTGRLEGTARPDPRGAGESHLYLALAARWTGATALGDAVEESYRHHGLLAAPEPGGWPVASSALGHRSVLGLDEELHHGARAILEASPGVTAWTHADARAADLAATVSSRAGAWPSPAAPSSLAAHGAVGRGLLATPGTRAAGAWPLLDAPTGVTSHLDEVATWRGQGWAASWFLGAPLDDVLALEAMAAPHRVPHPAEQLPGTVINVDESLPPWPANAGGMATLWMQDLGTAVLSTNWGPLAQHGLVVDQDGARAFADYASVYPLVDDATPLVAVEGAVPLPDGTQVTYTRSYEEDAEGALRVDVWLTADQDVTVERMVEVIPHPVCASGCGNNVRGRQVTVQALDGGPWVDGMQAGWRLMGQDGVGMEVRLDTPRNVRLAPVTYDRHVGLGLSARHLVLQPVLVDLPVQWTGGEPVLLSYTLAPVRVAPPDGGVVLPDAGETDAGTAVDAGTGTDGGSTPDGGPGTDAGATGDAGVTGDAGATGDGGGAGDSGTSVDAGGTPDGSVRVDGGASGDSGVLPADGGSSDAAVTPPGEEPGDGCGCSTGPADGLPAGALAWLGALVLLRARRRRAVPV